MPGLYGRIGQGQLANWATLGLVVLGPVLAACTFLVLGPLDLNASAIGLRLVLLADLVYVLLLATLVLQRIFKMVAARRARSAGSRLHLRLTGVFALVALIPTVLVAVFAGLTINVGMEGWFSERVRAVVGASLEAAEAYKQEHRSNLATDAEALARYLSAQRETQFLISDGDIRQVLSQAQAAVQRGLKEAYVIDSAGQIRARGERSYLFDYERPAQTDFAQAQFGETVIIEDWANNEFRALVKIDAFVDRFVFVSRTVDGDILTLLDDTQETARLYQQLEAERGRMLFEFGLLYLGFALILILAAIWLGLWFAERLSRPVGRLTSAAQRVGGGDLDVRVRPEQGDDEIAMLGHIFNQMTRQLKQQRKSLIDGNMQSEAQRRLFDSVLGSVTAGVMGLDAQGRVEFINRSGRALLSLDGFSAEGQKLRDVVPEFAEILDTLRRNRREQAQQEVKLRRGAQLENVLVRMAIRRGEDRELEGFVVAFDDVTELVTAQRTAAWGDVARRIAHEIKNPLTPIQLSAERLKRKFAREVSDPEKLGELTDMIVRQTEDLRRIVDEFSKFARMPEPEASRQDLVALARDAVTLQASGNPTVQVTATLPDDPIWGDVDKTLVAQMLTNVLKNAVEASEGEVGPTGQDGVGPEVRLSLSIRDGMVWITVDDNGPGFPMDRNKLFEPYVTTREKGTGLGLAIVKKIVEEHDGRLRLEDAEPFASGAPSGARVTIGLPLWQDPPNAAAREPVDTLEDVE
ncbi:MAG: PAS domain-containing sensor histidine kinase [Pseudomonadota bacterium]